MIMKTFQTSFVFSLMGVTFISLSMGMEKKDQTISLDTGKKNQQSLETRENNLKRVRDDSQDTLENDRSIKRQKFNGTETGKTYKVGQNNFVNNKLSPVPLPVDDFLTEIFESVESNNTKKEFNLCQNSEAENEINKEAEGDCQFSVTIGDYENDKRTVIVDNYYEDTRRYYNPQEMRSFKIKEFNSFLDQGRNTKGERGVDCLYKALRVAQDLGDWGLEYKIRFLLGKRNIRRSSEHLLKAFDLAKKNNSQRRQAEALLRMGNERIGDQKTCYLKALMISEMSNNKFFQCWAHIKLGDYYCYYERNNQKSFNSFEKAFTIAQESKQKEYAIKGMDRVSQK